jgi:hypothetical protein
MERFAERDVKLWRAWMDGETEYASAKFSDQDQLIYYRDGVNNGTYSWRTSSLAYFQRAVMRAPLLLDLESSPEKLAEAKLWMIRDLGKSAHNHMVLLVYAQLHHLGGEWREVYREVIEEVGGLLSPLDDKEVLKFKDLSREVLSEGEEYYQALEVLQDEGEYEGLRASALARAVYMNSGFLGATAEFGWSKPGLGSSDDVKPWDIAG